MNRNISLLVHGASKVGKTRLANTAPAPRLFLDAEGGTRFLETTLAGRTREWDPVTQRPPEEDGTWDNCVVYVRDFQQVSSCYAWLASGSHPFRSVIIDSISEVQQRCIDALAGTSQMQQQDWGTLLRSMSTLVRQFRDLTIHPTKPLEAVIIVAMTREYKDKWKPYVQGQLGTAMPYYLDVIGFMFVHSDPNTGERTERLLVSPMDQYEAGDRTGRLGQVVDHPNIVQMLDTIYGPATNTGGAA